VLVHTGQNYDYELNQIFFDDLGVRKPDHFLSAAGATGAETIGKVIIAVDQVLAEVQPEAMLVLGDTNSCLAVSRPSAARCPFSTWKPATAASISVCRRRSTGA
jgi:UDP-N-acetylglucosamine 2-epimerase